MSPAPPAGLRGRYLATVRLGRNIGRTLRLVWASNRALTLVSFLCYLVDSLSFIAAAYVGKRLIDSVIAAVQDPSHPVEEPLTWVGVELAIVVLRSLAGDLATYQQIVQRSELKLHVSHTILTKASNLSYQHFEDPGFQNAMALAREASGRPLEAWTQVITVIRQCISLIGFTALLWRLGALPVLAMLITALPPFFAEAAFGRQLFTMNRARTKRNRLAGYLESLLTMSYTAKEIKIFGLARWIIQRIVKVHKGFLEEESDLARRRGRTVFLLSLISTLTFSGIFAYIVIETIQGRFTLGDLALYTAAVRGGQLSLLSALQAISRLYAENLQMSNLFEFLGVPEDEVDDPSDPSAFLDGAAPTVTFEDVSFRYPNAERDTLSNIHLTLHAGQTVAVVGRNGAGKTTFVKLLVGLHRPTSGRILINGVDTATMSHRALRQRIGVIFQDFVRFNFTVAENIGVGWLPSMEDREALERAARDAGLSRDLEALPRRLDTPLGRTFEGEELSVGQWQRVALARALLRPSKIIVLDEPTAALDAEAEHEVFQRFRDLKRDRTALLVTHRFSSVRMADRIVVFHEGRIVEEGTHDELLAQDGRYAAMFRLQAEGYGVEPVPVTGEDRRPTGRAPGP